MKSKKHIASPVSATPVRRVVFSVCAAAAAFCTPACAYVFEPSVYTAGISFGAVPVRRFREEDAISACLFDPAADRTTFDNHPGKNWAARMCSDLQQLWGLNAYFTRPADNNFEQLKANIFVDKATYWAANASSWIWKNYYYEKAKFGIWDYVDEADGWYTKNRWEGRHQAMGYVDPYTFRENVLCSQANSGAQITAAAATQAVPASAMDFALRAMGSNPAMVVSTTCDDVYYDVGNQDDKKQQSHKNSGCRVKSGVVLNNFIKEFDLEAKYFKEGFVEDKHVDFLTNTTGKFVVLASGPNGPNGSESAPFSFFLSEDIPGLINEHYNTFGSMYLGALHSKIYTGEGSDDKSSEIYKQRNRVDYVRQGYMDDGKNYHAAHDGLSWLRGICDTSKGKSTFKFLGGYGGDYSFAGFSVDERFISGRAGYDDDDCMRFVEQMMYKNIALYQPLGETSGRQWHWRYANYGSDDTMVVGGERVSGPYINYLYERGIDSAATMGKCYTFNMDYYDSLRGDFRGPRWPLLGLRTRNFFYDNGLKSGPKSGTVHYVRNNHFFVDELGAFVNKYRSGGAFGDTFATQLAKKDIDGKFLQTDFSIHITSPLSPEQKNAAFALERTDGSKKTFKRAGLFSAHDKLDPDGGVFKEIFRSFNVREIKGSEDAKVRDFRNYRGFSLHLRPTSAKKSYRLCTESSWHCNTQERMRIYVGAGDSYAAFFGGNMSSANNLHKFNKDLMQNYYNPAWQRNAKGCNQWTGGEQDGECLRQYTYAPLAGSVEDYYLKNGGAAKAKFLVAFYPDADNIETAGSATKEQIYASGIALDNAPAMRIPISRSYDGWLVLKNRARYLEPRYVYKPNACGHTLASCRSDELEQYTIEGKSCFYRLNSAGGNNYSFASKSCVETKQVKYRTEAHNGHLAIAMDVSGVDAAIAGPVLMQVEVYAIYDAAGRPIYSRHGFGAGGEGHSGIIQAQDDWRHLFVVDATREQQESVGTVATASGARPTWAMIDDPSTSVRIAPSIYTQVHGQPSYIAVAAGFAGKLPAKVAIVHSSEQLTDRQKAGKKIPPLRLEVWDSHDKPLPLNGVREVHSEEDVKFIINTQYAHGIGKNTLTVITYDDKGNELEKKPYTYYVRPAKIELRHNNLRPALAKGARVNMSYQCFDAAGKSDNEAASDCWHVCNGQNNTSCVPKFTAGWWELPQNNRAAYLGPNDPITRVAAMRSDGTPLGTAAPVALDTINRFIMATPLVAAPMRLRLFEGGFVNVGCKNLSIDEMLRAKPEEMNKQDALGRVYCSIPVVLADGGVLKPRAQIKSLNAIEQIHTAANFLLASNDLERFALSGKMNLAPTLPGNEAIAGLFTDDEVGLKISLQYSSPNSATPVAGIASRALLASTQTAAKTEELACADNPSDLDIASSCTQLATSALDLSKKVYLGYQLRELNAPYEQLLSKIASSPQVAFDGISAALVKDAGFWATHPREAKISAGISSSKKAKNLKITSEAGAANMQPVHVTLGMKAGKIYLENDQAFEAFDQTQSGIFYALGALMPDVHGKSDNKIFVDPTKLQLFVQSESGQPESVKTGECAAAARCYYEAPSNLFERINSSYEASVAFDASKGGYVVTLEEARQKQNKDILHAIIRGEEIVRSSVEFAGTFRP